MKPKKSCKLPGPPLKAISEALNAAVADAVEVHRKAGLPLVVWQDGKVAYVSADDVAAKPNRTKPRRKKK